MVLFYVVCLGGICSAIFVSDLSGGFQGIAQKFLSGQCCSSGDQVFVTLWESII